jgi:hypothetical protein
VGLVQHASSEVDATDPTIRFCDCAYKESRHARHISDAQPRGGTRHLDDQLQPCLALHGAAMHSVGHLPVQLSAHLGLHRWRLPVSHRCASQILTDHHERRLW